MKFNIERNILLSKLNVLDMATNPKASLPILGSIKFSLIGKSLSLTSTDLESTIHTEIEVSNEEGSGGFCLESKVLKSAIKTVPSSASIEVEIDMASNRATFRYPKNGSFELPVLPADDFPSLPNKESTNEIVLSNKAFKDALSTALPFCGSDELRPMLSGVFLEVVEGKAFMCATDSFSLCAQELEVSKASDCGVVIPYKGCSILSKSLDNSEDNCHIYLSSKHVCVKVFDYEFYSRLIEGAYPKWRTVIPVENTIECSFIKEDVNLSIDRALAFDISVSNISIASEGNALSIKSKDIERGRGVVDEVPCSANADFSFWVKLSILRKSYNVGTGDTAYMYANDSNRGVLFKSDDGKIISLCMPCRGLE